MNTSTSTELATIKLRQTLKNNCDQNEYVCNNCDCWLDLLDGEPIDGCRHDIQHEDIDKIVACIQCGMVMNQANS